MKKFTIHLLTFALLLSLVGCGKPSSDTDYATAEDNYTQIYLSSSEDLAQATCFCSTEKGILAAVEDSLYLYDRDMTGAEPVFSVDVGEIDFVSLDKNGNIAMLSTFNGEQTIYTTDFDGVLISSQKVSCTATISQLLFTAENEPLLVANGAVHDADGHALIDNDSIDFLVQTNDNILVVDHEGAFHVLNEADMTWQEPIIQTSRVLAAVAYGSYVYFSNDDGVFYYDPQQGTLTQKIDWASNQDPFSLAAVVSDTDMLAYKWALSGTKYFYLLTPGNGSTATAKQVITMAGWSIYPWVEMAVEEFNKTNAEYRIEFEDYFDTYGDRTLSDADTKLLLRFSSGDIPDILCMNANSYEDYADAGLLMDMYPLMEADEAFEKDSLIENVLTAMEKEGQLLQISPFFEISTLVGYAPQVGDISSWTMDEFEVYMDSLPSDTVWIRNMSDQTFLKRLLNANIDVLLDTSGDTCAFESEDFIKMMELASRFPSEDDLALTTYADVYDGKVAMVDFNIHSTDEINDITTIFRGQPAIVSYPSDCNTGALGSSSCRLGISAVSSHSEEAWKFISSTLSQKFLDSLAGVGFGFPLNEASFENVLQKAAQEPLNTSENKIPKTLNGGLQVEDRALSQDEVDAVREMVFSINQFGGCISTVLDIVEEEAAAYFDGNKTAEAVAEVIQNRVQTYLNERE